jgi:hypothetical protein
MGTRRTRRGLSAMAISMREDMGGVWNCRNESIPLTTFLLFVYLYKQKFYVVDGQVERQVEKARS